jgi:hypothetical protein
VFPAGECGWYPKDVAHLSLVEHDLHLPSWLRLRNPPQHERGAVNPPELSQGLGKLVLLGVIVKIDSAEAR